MLHFIPGTFHVYRKYLTDEDIHWKNAAEDRKTEYETMALEHTWKKCDELADQFPEDRLFAILDIYMKVHEFDETHEEHKQ
ncbi:hypothetical protein KSF78_0008463 [Schistosoma japonicum]|nr:hypothetical protein KSF78_0008463 [Schistosoma japonicum]